MLKIYLIKKQRNKNRPVPSDLWFGGIYFFLYALLRIPKRSKKIIIPGLSILLTGLILFGVFSFVFHYDTVVPYAESLIKIEIQDDDIHQCI